METRLGNIEVKEEKIINFKNGLLGFEEQKKFIILDHPGTDTIKWLQSIEDKDLALPLINPAHFFPNYSPRIPLDDLKDLKIKTPQDAVVLCVISIPQDIKKAVVNLKAPVIINPTKRLADQLIAQNPEYNIREPLNLSKTPKPRRCESC